MRTQQTQLLALRLRAVVCPDMHTVVRGSHTGGLVVFVMLVACSGGDRVYNKRIADASVDAAVDTADDASSSMDSAATNTVGGGTINLTLDRSNDAGLFAMADAEAGTVQMPRDDGGRNTTTSNSNAPSSNTGEESPGEEDASSPSDAASSGVDTGTTGAPDASVTLDSTTETSDSVSTNTSDTVTTNTSEETGNECQPTGGEQCFNQLDDDCNELTDCEDPACAASATCEPAGMTQGLLVEATEDCPVGYQERIIELYQGLDAPGCSGCTCSGTVSECTGELYFYMMEGDCDADPSASGGVLVEPVTAECPNTPHQEGFTEGYRIGAIELVEGTGACTASGSPTLGTPTWLVSMKYCVADTIGSGCEPGYACVPVADSGTVCVESEGPCSGDQVTSTWYEEYLDERTCGACSCDGEGGCDDVQVEVGSDWACNVGNPATSAGEQRCDITPYSPPAMLVGTPTQPSCEPSSSIDGEVTPLGMHTLCCTE